MTTTERGQHGEDFAAQALERRGYQLVERNWRCPGGEIDLIMREGEVWVFVEVKLRSRADYGTPEEAVDERKRARLLQAALLYLDEHGLPDAEWRIDVVAIETAPSGRVERLSQYKNAVIYG